MIPGSALTLWGSSAKLLCLVVMVEDVATHANGNVGASASNRIMKKILAMGIGAESILCKRIVTVVIAGENIGRASTSVKYSVGLVCINEGRSGRCKGRACTRRCWLSWCLLGNSSGQKVHGLGQLLLLLPLLLLLLLPNLR